MSQGVLSVRLHMLQGQKEKLEVLSQRMYQAPQPTTHSPQRVRVPRYLNAE